MDVTPILVSMLVDLKGLQDPREQSDNEPLEHLAVNINEEAVRGAAPSLKLLASLNRSWIEKLFLTIRLTDLVEVLARLLAYQSHS